MNRMNDGHLRLNAAPAKPAEIPSRTKTIFIIFEILLVIILSVIWFSSESIRKSKSLWILFFYSLPAEFFIATVPHEPALLYFGKFYSPSTVALVAVVSTVLTEMINYSVIKFIADLRFFQKVIKGKTLNRVIELFNKAPFAALWVAGVTPIPFYPFRFLVVLAHYPWWKYGLAVFLSRAPRFFFYSWLGLALKIPDYLLIVLFIVLIFLPGIPLLRRIFKKLKSNED